MLLSAGFIILSGIALSYVFNKIRVPRIIAFLAFGIIFGPYGLNLIDSKLLNISVELRQIALIIILLKAGLSFNLSDLKRNGRSAFMLCFVPATFEIVAFMIFSPFILGLNVAESLVLGAVMAAVSPAVVVPRMVQLIDENRGTDKKIPQMILSGASADDVFVIVLFSVFLVSAQSGILKMSNFILIPLKIIFAFIVGIFFGSAVSFVFNKFYKCGHKIRNSIKLMIMISISMILVSSEEIVSSYFPFSSYLAVMCMACIVRKKTPREVYNLLSMKFGRLWIGAEIFLFVLVGATVDVKYSLNSGPSAIVLILLCLFVRCIGVWFCLIKTELNMKERIFCVISYLPKATVQAAIGGIPVSMGLQCGQIVLSAAVTAILITAPLGALGMDLTCKKLLSINL